MYPFYTALLIAAWVCTHSVGADMAMLFDKTKFI